MEITILEAMKLPTFKEFELVAGYRGLDSKIQRVSILDYEYETSLSNKSILDYFSRGDFVVSSLIYAKDDPSLILESVRRLVSDGVVALAVKKIYYDILPEEVIQYANENDFPIFMIDKKGSFYEDIVTEIYEKNKEKNSITLNEAKIGILLSDEMEKSSIKNLAMDLNIAFKENLFAICLKGKKYMEDGAIYNVINTLNSNFEPQHSVFKYHEFIFIIYTFDEDKSERLDNQIRLMLASLQINKAEFNIGISNFHNRLDEINYALREAKYAMRTANIRGKDLLKYRDIGVFKIIMPAYREDYMVDFYNETIGRIKNYDKKYNTELLQTALEYVRFEGNIKKVAKEINLHENTVRYRVSKIREILNIDNTESRFYEELSIGVKLYLIYKNI